VAAAAGQERDSARCVERPVRDNPARGGRPAGAHTRGNAAALSASAGGRETTASAGTTRSGPLGAPRAARAPGPDSGGEWLRRLDANSPPAYKANAKPSGQKSRPPRMTRQSAQRPRRSLAKKRKRHFAYLASSEAFGAEIECSFCKKQGHVTERCPSLPTHPHVVHCGAEGVCGPNPEGRASGH
jgi:hypothetical protein